MSVTGASMPTEDTGTGGMSMVAYPLKSENLQIYSRLWDAKRDYGNRGAPLVALDATVNLITGPPTGWGIDPTGVANIARIRQLGWAPVYDLNAGLKKTIELEFNK